MRWCTLIQKGTGTGFAFYPANENGHRLQHLNSSYGQNDTSDTLAVTALRVPGSTLSDTKNCSCTGHPLHATRCSFLGWAKWSCSLFLLKPGEIWELRVLLPMGRGELPPVVIAWACWTDGTGRSAKTSSWHWEQWWQLLHCPFPYP